jgi:hypothetical protein
MTNYKVLPEVPTDEMIKAVFTSDKEWGNDYAPPKSDCIAVYKAMYAAAPITKQDLIDDYNNNHKPQAECEPVGEIQHLDELNSVCTSKLQVGTKLYTIPQDQSKRIDELEAENLMRKEIMDEQSHYLRRLNLCIGGEDSPTKYNLEQCAKYLEDEKCLLQLVKELEADKQRLIEALDYALSECKMLGKDICNFGMDYFYDETFEDELKLLAEMKKG